MKIFLCDKCGEEAIVLYDLILADGEIISVCRACFYATETDELLTENIIWHLTKDGAITLCGLDRDKTQDMINVIYAGREPDEGEWCKECHFQHTGLIWEKDELLKPLN